MLDPISELLLFVGVLYLVECLRWVSPSSVALRSLVPGRWKVARPHRIGAHWRRALVPGAPWPPFGGIFVSDHLPFCVTREGILLRPHRPEGWTKGASDDELVVDWGRVSVSGVELRVDGKARFVLGSRRLATEVKRLFKGLREGEAQALERFFESRFDLVEGRRRWLEWRRASPGLLVTSHLLFFSLLWTLWALVKAPYGLSLLVPLGLFLLTWMTGAAIYELTLRRLLPKALRPPPGRRVVTMLSPLSLIRAGDELRPEVLGDLDPLALSRLLLSEKDFAAWGRSTLAALEHPLLPESPSEDPRVSDLERAHRQTQTQMVKGLLSEAGLDPRKLLEQAPLQSGARAWCPRCLATFARESEDCSSCRGVSLRVFS